MELDFLSKRMEVGHVCGVQPVFDYSFLIHSLIPELSILLTPPRCENGDQNFSILILRDIAEEMGITACLSMMG